MEEPASIPDPAVIAELLDACANAQASDQELSLTAFIARFPEHEASLRAAYATRTAPADTSEKTIGPYRILRELGHGGMGRVYLAEQSEPFERQVALKVIKLGMDTAEILKRFDRERQALALMDHDAIARVYNAGSTATGQPYVALEYVKGEPLTNFCDRNRLSLRERILLMCRICDGVQHAHQKGIVHRDLTPGNILVTESSRGPSPKIIDFGIARIVNEGQTDATNTVHGLVLGTPSYMSPEQAGYRDLDVDSRSDVYSLGVLLFELLTGTLPYTPQSAMDLDEIQRRSQVGLTARPSANIRAKTKDNEAAAACRKTDPRSLQRLLRGDLDAIVAMALATDRQQRYGTAEALAADLRRFLDLRPITAKRATLVDSARKAVRRHRQLLSTACLVLAGIAAWVTAYLSSNELRLSREAASAMVWPFLAKAPGDDWLLTELDFMPPTERAGAHYVLTLLAKRDKEPRRIAQHLPGALSLVDSNRHTDPALATRNGRLAVAALASGRWQLGLDLASAAGDTIGPDDEFGDSLLQALIQTGRYDQARQQCIPAEYENHMLEAGSWALRTTGVSNARRIYTRAHREAIRTNNAAMIGTALLRLGGVAWFEGDYPQAIETIQLALRSHDEPNFTMNARNSLGTALRDAERFAAAEHELNEALQAARAQGSSTEIRVLNNLGRTALRQGNTAQAEEHFQAAVRASDRFYQPSLQERAPYHGATYAESMLGLGMIASLRNEHDQALLLIQTARVIWQRAAGPQSDQVGETESVLGAALGRSNRTDLEFAERLMLDGYAKIVALRTPKARISRMAQARLVEFAERNGRTEQANVWRQLHQDY